MDRHCMSPNFYSSSNGNPHSPDHHCKCLESNTFDGVFLSTRFVVFMIFHFQTTRYFSCLCTQVKSQSFHLVYMTVVKYSKKSHLMMSSISEQAMITSQTFNGCYCLIFQHKVPVNILCRYAIGCPPIYKRLQVLASKFDANLWSATDIELWSTRSHWVVKVVGVKPVAAWKSCRREEPESWLQKWQAEI